MSRGQGLGAGMRIGWLSGAVLLALLGGGCALSSGPPGPSATSIVVPQTLDTTSSRDAGIVGGALQFSMLTPTSFSAEPKGDVTTDGVTRVYAHISSVTTAPAAVTFDVEQLYLGDSAVAQAKADHKTLDEAALYERNAYRHSQTTSVVASTGVVLQSPREGVDRAYGPDDFAQLTATTFEDFAKRFSAGEQSHALKQAGYWIVIDSDGVRNIAEQYAP